MDEPSGEEGWRKKDRRFFYFKYKIRPSAKSSFLIKIDNTKCSSAGRILWTRNFNNEIPVILERRFSKDNVWKMFR